MKWIFSHGLFSGFVLYVVDSRGSKLLWPHDGRMRYSHDCWFSWRGAVKAVPESFSA
jgi:hypothetical protein